MTKRIETKSLACPHTPCEAKAIISCESCGTAWSYGKAYTYGWRIVVDKPYTYRCAACVPKQKVDCSNCRHQGSRIGPCEVCNPEMNDQWQPINQCDGCRRSLPLKDGIHYGDDYDMIACTKERYL